MTSVNPDKIENTEALDAGQSREPMKLKIKRLVSLIRHSTLELYRLEGKYRGSPMRVLIADDGSTLNYIRNLIFSDEPITLNLGTISAFAGPSLAHSDADIVVVGANHVLLSAYEKQNFCIVPKWIRLFVPIWDHPNVMFNSEIMDRATRKYFRRLARTIESAGYSFGVTVEPKWFDYFYYRMYLPYARRRHHELAVIHSYNRMKQSFSCGMGVTIAKDGTPIGGGIVIREGKTISFRHMGMLDGNVEASRDGASSALDYFVVQFGYSLGCNQMNFGHTRAFTSDGVLRYKLTWQAHAKYDDDAVSVFAVSFPGSTLQARKFVSENRFFQLTRTGVELCNEY